MKIIQSFWSAPTKTKGITEGMSGRPRGGWPTEKYHAISWALSCWQLKRFYNHVVLYSDKDGMEWLVDRCGLPYDEVNVNLDCLNRYDALLWAIPKIYTYSLQKSPFLHVDGDVFIWKPFDKTLLSAPLIVQNFEDDEITSDILQELKHSSGYIPNYLEALDYCRPVQSINAGIIGGNEYSFFSLFAKEVFYFLESNMDFIRDFNSGNFNMVFEQVLCYYLAREYGIPIRSYTNEVGKEHAYLLKLNTVPQKHTYVHMVGYAKANILACCQMEAHLKYLHPKMYNHICSIYRDVRYYSPSFEHRNELVLSQTLLMQFLKEDINQKAFQIKDVKYRTELEEQIESILEKNFHDSRTYLLSDVYQLEKSMTELKAEKETVDVSYLYDFEIEDFLSIPLEINYDYCRVVYLYHGWDENFSLNLLQQAVEGKILLDAKDEQPYLLCTKEAQLKIEPLTGWKIVYNFLEAQPLSGFNILETLKKQRKFHYKGKSLELDLYDFLTFQLFALRYLKISDIYSEAKEGTAEKKEWSNQNVFSDTLLRKS